ncbi:hypothetical protein NBG4_30006 [Candidatus Sulfobium mesophilum]|uniref:Uncharacterized protein n=1 Tax=Candidatus Sulfobium mesophilum TaxID=2016548 RepID=A0A2U3QGT1_9BACT|nr:hypothetical protein NBG4_30006 [Candidatus Sulfobium mesophilum]
MGESQFSYKTKSGDYEKATKLLDMPFFILNITAWQLKRLHLKQAHIF